MKFVKLDFHIRLGVGDIGRGEVKDEHGMVPEILTEAGNVFYDGNLKLVVKIVL